MNAPTPPAIPPNLKAHTLEQLIDLIETLQRTIRFLVSEYNTLLDLVTESGANTVFGPLVNVASGAPIGRGWWQVVSPTDGTPLATVTISGQVVQISSEVFWSDGTPLALQALELSKIASPPTPASSP